MILMKKLRAERGVSQRQLKNMSRVHESDICKAESRGLRLYPAQAARVAEALGWQGDPMELFEEVGDDGPAVA